MELAKSISAVRERQADLKDSCKVCQQYEITAGFPFTFASSAKTC